jgi:8-oxo-dGTP pyrophosphatase MutT (NUDIX family)
VIVRPTARIILFDPEGRVLLFKYQTNRVHDPSLPAGAVQPEIFWSTPGGGLMPDESFADAAKRELWEETGITDAAFGPVVFERDKLVHIDGVGILGQERYFLAHTTVTEISLNNQEALERADYRDHRWWTLVELDATDEVIFPEGIAARIRAIQVDDDAGR